MNEFEPFYRLALAIAIGLLVGVERHWRERELAPGRRTAGIRTFAMIGMLGGVVGLIEKGLPPGGQAGIATGIIFLAFSTVFAFYQWRESEAEGEFSVTSVIAAMATFLFGVLAVLGDLKLAAAGGVTLVAILASREPLHRFIKKMSWVELRSAIILLTMTFVILPLLPHTPYGPFGGISLRSVWSLAILLAAISYVGYVAIRLFGAGRGELAAGAAGGLVSSTAVTLDNARRSTAGHDVAWLAGGAAVAGCASYLRTGALVLFLAPPLAWLLLPPFIAGALAMAAGAAWLVRGQSAKAHKATSMRNPFELTSVLKLTLFLAAIGFAVRAASAAFGSAGIVFASALSGIGDVDAATVTVAGLPSLETSVGALAIAAAVASNTVAKAIYAVAAGDRAFGWRFGAVSAVALVVGGAAFWAANVVMAGLNPS
ncbi:membrane protein [Kaistia sp. 32K]|uniref:MgtC/SapB family protein n=1 Tax=Kaistia sp. 32K TaxID=2795690 RepID=UPI001935C5AB|nr:DUF4010 domain-containing protein [Kaistia sp. 32K]BCP52968.1 membrane protein [Kaistia sp. 32K]